MSVSHTSTLALPPLQAHPHTRLATARAPHIRLPSYRELTSQCEVPPTAARSSLFTAGLIHLPPLRVPGATSGGSSPNANANRGREDKEYDEPHRHSAEHTEREKDKAPPRALGLAARPHPSAYGLAAYAHPDPTSYFHNNSYNASASGNANTNGSGNGNAAVYATALALEHAAFDLTPKLKFSHAKAGGRTKKQALSCFFCRERKIACGRPEGEALGAGGQEGACNQCARRKIPCTYPTVSHRGQHSRIKSAARKAHSGGRDDGTPVRGPYLAGDDDAGGRPMAMDVDSGRRETRATRATRVAS
ncbi:hypothetical protein B0H15DRAFT_21227 [Mycena belliarum]|uniref:Zn(2)-C6 fungal-type domain-containing protein n=1 Tax=Mycena belliarum TaxID=1033014 RepID=A0AAD6XWR0_9AGAR|nr:hypothetical protein B0H15DRAFT_21227 [Mycena belliae]